MITSTSWCVVVSGYLKKLKERKNRAQQGGKEEERQREEEIEKGKMINV